jgi:glyoxylase-like metal-dependent hydrolase (beta-lactamase superfamily II)
MEAVDRLPEGVARVRADNPSPMTLDGTNTYVAAGWVVDPGPDDERHLQAVLAAAGGKIDGIVLTHAHIDHSQGADRLASLAGGAPLRHPGAGDDPGPFEVLRSPGHSADSVCLIHGRICFSGDTILGEGSVFIPGDGGGLAAYLDALQHLASFELDVICPGHGPIVWDPADRIAHYLAHRLEREHKVLAALEAGARTTDEILDRAWDDAPIDTVPMLRTAAAATLDAHLEKLRAEGRIPG